MRFSRIWYVGFCELLRYSYIKHFDLQSEENRVAVMSLPYSDPETVPTLVPQHVLNEAYQFPSDFNLLLCQLLEVENRKLFPCLPVPVVQPNVSLYNIQRIMSLK